jgi:riboflavin kinase/FMN adenylyltransferase
MKVIYGIGRLKLSNKSCVAVGVFDGLHLGHRSIIKKAVSIARKNKALSVVLTFFPHPDSIIHSERKSPLLISLKHRLSLISALGVDVCVVVKFNTYFMNISADNFIRDILIKRLHMKFLVLNKNFTFGKGRTGNEKLIKRLSKKFNFRVYFQKDIKSNNHIISSTLIRSLIRSGNLKKASELLGRKVEVVGIVIGGDKRGRKIGFPTANIDPHHEVVPPKGVYLIEAYLSNRKLFGLANIGFRPTFKKEDSDTIEIHLLNFRENIYGKDIRVVFLKKLRKENKFKNKASLIKRINKDITQAKRFFSL